MLHTETLKQARILTLLSGNFSRKEYRNLTIDQMLELGQLVVNEGIWKPRKNNELVDYEQLSNDIKFECMFDPQFNFHKVLERIDIFVGKQGEVFFSERSN